MAKIPCKHGYAGAKQNPQLCLLCQEEKQELERKRIQGELVLRQQAEKLRLEQEAIKKQEDEIKKRQEAIQKQQEDKLRRQLQWWKSLDGVQFENELAIFLRQLGYDVTMTPYSRDGGVDLVLLSDTEHIVVQCKAHNDDIGPRAIRELYGTMIHEKADKGWLVTTSGFSSNARQFAQDKPIKLITIEKLLTDTHSVERNDNNEKKHTIVLSSYESDLIEYLTFYTDVYTDIDPSKRYSGIKYKTITKQFSTEEINDLIDSMTTSANRTKSKKIKEELYALRERLLKSIAP